MEIIPLLKKIAQVDILISGSASSIKFPHEIKYQCKGLSFVFGENGGIDYWNTYKQIDSRKFLKSVFDLPVENYNLVINDFEPVSAWSAKFKEVPCFALSHQCAVLNRFAPKPVITDPVAYSFLKYFAPANQEFGFHFQEYDTNIHHPVIRQSVREAAVKDKGHIAVYLPAYSEEKLYKKFSRFSDIEWKVFSIQSKGKSRKKNVTFYPPDSKKFTKAIASSNGIVCGGGFETPAEALFLKKKLLVIPMAGQFEQECNAYALDKMGVNVMKNLKEKRMHMLTDWLNESRIPTVDYQNDTQKILELVMDSYESSFQ
jgi:uncharacterized protein (TIGR00661 family)